MLVAKPMRPSIEAPSTTTYCATCFPSTNARTTGPVDDERQPEVRARRVELSAARVAADQAAVAVAQAAEPATDALEAVLLLLARSDRVREVARAEAEAHVVVALAVPQDHGAADEARQEAHAAVEAPVAGRDPLRREPEAVDLRRRAIDGRDALAGARRARFGLVEPDHEVSVLVDVVTALRAALFVAGEARFGPSVARERARRAVEHDRRGVRVDGRERRELREPEVARDTLAVRAQGARRAGECALRGVARRGTERFDQRERARQRGLERRSAVARAGDGVELGAQAPRRVLPVLAIERVGEVELVHRPAPVDGERPHVRGDRVRALARAQEKPRGEHGLFLAEARLGAIARPHPDGLVEHGRRVGAADVLGELERPRLPRLPVEARDPRRPVGAEVVEGLRPTVASVAERREEVLLRLLRRARALLEVEQRVAEEDTAGRVLARAQVDVERVPRDVVVAVVVDRALDELQELRRVAVALDVRGLDRAQRCVGFDERLRVRIAVRGAGPDGLALREPRRDAREERAVEAVRELVHEPVPKAFDRRRAAAAREAQRRRVAALEAAGPPERRALGLEARRLGHDAHEARLADERVRAVPAREALMVRLDRLRDAEQRRVTAVGFDAVPTLRAHGDAGVAERVVRAREGLGLVRVERFELVDGPRALRLARELRARLAEEFLRGLREAAEARGLRALQVLLPSDLHGEPREDARRLDRVLRPPGALRVAAERLHRAHDLRGERVGRGEAR
ncbi:MAG: hypothetical protein IPJ77_09520 [Planctomycetes bacterium]|nr:hypothetical protein [Planctomycetota bacterium]